MKWVFSAVLFFTPFLSSAQVIITEIMYDLPGSDSGREWIEIQNTSDQPIDLSAWKFYEEGSNHKLSGHNDSSAVLGSFEYAVIADEPEKFLKDWSSYSGILIDSSWSSLNNTGETLVLRDGELVDRDTVVYNSEQGASGDEYSLQLVNGNWKPLAPSPGAKPSENIQEKSSETKNEIQEKGKGPAFIKRPSINIILGPERVVSVGADSVFEAELYGSQNEPLSGARVIWNFGNGKIVEGEQVLHHYEYPGEYTVVVTASQATYSKYAVSEQFTVIAEPASVSLSYVSPEYIEIRNEGDRDLDLSFWLIRSGHSVFMLPEHTTLAAQNSVKFSYEVTGLGVPNKFDVALLYPNHEEMIRYIEEIVEASDILEAPIVIAQEPHIEVEEVDEVEVEVVEEVASSLPAAVISSEPENGFPWWYIALFGVILLPVLFIITIGGSKDESFEITDADEGN